MIQEDSQRIESSSSLPLHLKLGDDLNGVSRISDRRRHHQSSSMSKRVNITRKNGYAHGQNEDYSTSMEGFYISNETASTSSLSSLSQPEHKYTRRKNKKSGAQRDQLFLMMLALVVFSCFVSIYSTPQITDLTDNDYNTIDYFSEGYMVQRSKDNPPRLVTLNADHFGSFKDNPINMSSVTLYDLYSETDTAVVEPISEQQVPTNSSQIEAPPSETAKNQKKCLPMAKWMTASFPNCNSIHEISMEQGLLTRTYDDEDDLKFLAQGWFRDTWKYANENFEEEPPVVLKTLRIEREFLDEYFDLHRRDAVAMERLTFSPYVVNVHGYCGQSAINEFAEGVFGGKINNLEQLNRKLRGKESDPQALFLKLQLATKVSLGLAHIHNIHVSDNSGGNSKSVQSLLYEHTGPNTTHSTTGFGRSIATMAHYDINPRNIAVMKGGSPKINDFNIAEFLTYDPETNQPCGFRSRLHEPWWRAPEEMDTSHQTFVDEKVDIYALGEVLFHILTTHGPRGKMKKYRMDEVRALVKDGVPPEMWEPYASGGKNGALKKNPIVKAFMKAMDLCFEKDPKQRGTSIQVARILHKALVKEEMSRQQVKEQAEKLKEGASEEE